MHRTRRVLWVGAVVLATVVAGLLRLRAVEGLPQDYDEPVYFLAAQHYARAMGEGDWGEVAAYRYVLEHPPLAKLVYAAVLTRLPELAEIPEQPTNPPPAQPYPLPQPQFRALRLTAAFFGTLQVLVLALLNPLAGLFLAIQTFTVKYTSQVYLEAFPAFTSLAAVVAYQRSGGRRWGWLAVSAAALGLTAASKYLYAVAGVAIVVHWLWTGGLPAPAAPGAASPLGTRRDTVRRLARVLAWGAGAVAVFWAADPFLWQAPAANLKASVLFNAQFSQSAHVQSAGLPAWQPLVWLLMSVPWHPGVFAVSLDVLITLLAMVGFGRQWRQRSVFAVWLAVGIAFLLAWPTKWPQYILVVTAPLSMVAAEGFLGEVWAPLARRVRAWGGGLGPRKSRNGTEGLGSEAGAVGRLVGGQSGAGQGQEVAALGRGGEAAGRSEVHAQRGARTGPAGRGARNALPWLVPGAIVLSVIALFPMIYQAAMALTDFQATAIRDGLSGGVWREVWRGLSGQTEAVTVALFSRSGSGGQRVHYAGPGLLLQLVAGTATPVLIYELIWTFLAVGCQTALGLGVALMLQRPGVRFRGWWRAVFILPWAIPEFVGALIWAQMFDPRFGWLSLAGRSFPQRMDFPLPFGLATAWQEDPRAALVVLVVAATWYGFPFMMLAATAGLKLTPADVYDAVAIDGAGGWQRFRRITWPLLLPLLAPAIIIRAIFTFNQFYLYYVLGTPYPATTFAVTSFVLFDRGQYAVSAAINLLTVLALVGLILWFDRRSKAAEGVTYA